MARIRRQCRKAYNTSSSRSWTQAWITVSAAAPVFGTISTTAASRHTETPWPISMKICRTDYVCIYEMKKCVKMIRVCPLAKAVKITWNIRFSGHYTLHLRYLTSPRFLLHTRTDRTCQPIYTFNGWNDATRCKLIAIWGGITTRSHRGLEIIPKRQFFGISWNFQPNANTE